LAHQEDDEAKFVDNIFSSIPLAFEERNSKGSEAMSESENLHNAEDDGENLDYQRKSGGIIDKIKGYKQNKKDLHRSIVAPCNRNR